MYEASHRHVEPLFDEIKLSAEEIQLRTITVADLRQCLREGYADFMARPISIPFQIAFYFLLALVIFLFASGQDLRYLAFPIVAGFNLIGPIIAIAFFEMSRQRELGQPMRWSSAFSFIHTSSFAPILALSIVMMALYVAWLYIAELIFFSLFGENLPVSLSAFINELFSTRHGGALIVYGNFTGFLFACAALAISVVAFPLALDKPVTSFTAISVSIRAFSRNFYVMAAWGLMVVAIVTLGAALFLIGLAVALPVLGHATWHLYRKLVVQ
jgi:uncharacterized membrane protein